MEESRYDVLVDETGKMATRLTEPDAAKQDGARPERSTHEMIQWDPPSDEIASGIARAQLRLVVPFEGLEGFPFDQP